MPKAVYKVHEAPVKTRWTLARHDTPLQSPTAPDEPTMQTAHYPGHPRDLPSPRYDSYDGSDYGASLARTTSLGWKGGHSIGHSLTGRDLYEDYEYSPPSDERDDQHISLNTRVRPQNTDEVGQHLLYETALLDSQSYDIMQISEVDALKKEHSRLNSRIEAAQRKLALESKVKDAAQNLQRLYSINSKNRPDTPQSPQSPNHSGSNKGRNSSDSFDNTLTQAENELAASVRKVDTLNETIKGLLERRQMVERKLLKHTAAVLAEQTSRPNTMSAAALSQRHRADSDDGTPNGYSPDEFDGIRDIIFGNGSGYRSRNAKNAGFPDGQMASIQTRLENLNDQLRRVIETANNGRAEPEPAFDDAKDDPSTRLDKRFMRLEANLKKLEQEQRENKAHYDRVEQSTFMTKNAVEEQLSSLSNLAHNTLLTGSDMQEMQTLREPPQVTGNGYQHQLQYLEESLMSMEQLLQQHSQELHSARESGKDVQSRAASHASKNGEYETTIAGLWDILQSEGGANGERSSSQLQQDFSLPAFSARVQHIFDRAQAAKDQQEILRRQIQQQRDLNGKSDTEKDRQIAELEKSHENLSRNHSSVQEKLAKALADQTNLESEASKSRSDHMNVMNELEQMKRTVDAKHQEREDLNRQLKGHQETAAEMQANIEALEAELENQAEAVSKHSALTEQLATAEAAREEAAQKHSKVQKDMEGLESEVVRLATELTMAKAELDGAYGTRAERAKDAQASQVDALSERNQTLEKELQEMTTEFQELTKESIDMEKEREQLDGLLDDLRERCEELELQLSEEKVNGLGLKPAESQEGGTIVRESTSMTVMRQEFKKMMRETRAEGIKLLKAEQEERRKLELEVRRLRPNSSAIPVRSSGPGGSASTLSPIVA